MRKVILAFCCLATCSAGKIDSRDLLIGDWNTTLRCSKSWFAEVFPPRVSADSLVRRRRLSGKSQNFPCVLSLYSNGTFGLEPNALLVSGASPSPLLSVHGRWTLNLNPYCVTDRYYDDLVLESYSRVQKKVVEEHESVLRKVRLKLQCRLYGHFSGGRLHFRDRGHFARGKLSRGVLAIERDGESMKPFWRSRPRIAATFSAKRLIASKTCLVGNENK